MIEEGDRLFPRLFAPEQISPELFARREDYIQTTLAEIDCALIQCTEDTRSMFILFFGLNGEHGLLTYESIADLYRIGIDDVRKHVSQAIGALSEEQVKFVRNYYTLYSR